jgi:thiamine biosynthesis lipoprotein
MENYQVVQYAMGTVMSHHAIGDNARERLNAVQAEVIRLENLFSRFIPGSDISRINHSAGIRRELVSRETYDLLSRAEEYSTRCDGCFDVTIGPLVDLWRKAKNLGGPPDKHSIHETLPLTGYSDLLLDPPNQTAGLARAGQSIDVGGIGKGYAADRVLEIYREYGIESACSNMGGNVVTLGSKPDGSPWQIGIQHPRCDEALIGAVSVTGKSVVTSGDYQRYFEDIHRTRYHHILDPLTGYPADSGLVSVTIIADSSTTADALSTIVFVAGLARGLEILSGYSGAEAVLVDREMRVWITPGLVSSFHAAEGVELTVLSKEMDF